MMCAVTTRVLGGLIRVLRMGRLRVGLIVRQFIMSPAARSVLPTVMPKAAGGLVEIQYLSPQREQHTVPLFPAPMQPLCMLQTAILVWKIRNSVKAAADSMT